MAFIVKKIINGNEYYYLNENKRVDGKVKTKTLAYLGKSKKDATLKAKEILGKVSESPKNKINFRKVEKKDICIEELATFCKRRGFIYQSGEIYGGLAGFWDFGPLGIELFNNIKKLRRALKEIYIDNVNEANPELRDIAEIANKALAESEGSDG